jgi:hypothetical protein
MLLILWDSIEANVTAGDFSGMAGDNDDRTEGGAVTEAIQLKIARLR